MRSGETATLEALNVTCAKNTKDNILTNNTRIVMEKLLKTLDYDQVSIL